jgi:MFS family permease
MPIAGRFTDRHGGGLLSLIGVTLTTIFTIPLALVGAHTSILYLTVMMFLRGTGMGLCFVPTMTAAYASLKRSELSDATPQLNVLMRVGASIGTAVLAVVLERAAAVAVLPCLWLLRGERQIRAQRQSAGSEPPGNEGVEPVVEVGAGATEALA